MSNVKINGFQWITKRWLTLICYSKRELAVLQSSNNREPEKTTKQKRIKEQKIVDDDYSLGRQNDSLEKARNTSARAVSVCIGFSLQLSVRPIVQHERNRERQSAHWHSIDWPLKLQAARSIPKIRRCAASIALMERLHGTCSHCLTTPCDPSSSSSLPSIGETERARGWSTWQSLRNIALS